MTARLRNQLAALTTLADTLDGKIPNPWPQRIRTTLDYLDANIDDALTNLRIATPDGWGTNSSGGDMGGGGRASGTSTTVEAALTGRLHFAGDSNPDRNERDSKTPLGPVAVVQRLEELVRDGAALIGDAIQDPDEARTKCQSANDLLKQACSLIDRWITRNQIETSLKSTLRCGCGTLPGWLKWGDPLCENIADEALAGLCIPCHRKREAWRVEQYRQARRQEIHREI